MTPQEAVDAYAEAGYDFLALSDHDVVSDASGLDCRGLVLITACEVSGEIGHVLAVGSGSGAVLRAGISQQDVIDAAVKGGGIPVLCHPNWGKGFNHYTIDQLAGLSGYAGIEVFNGSIVGVAGSAISADKWDMLLGRGKNVFGFAGDDTHSRLDVGKGWNMVLAGSKSKDAILDAIRVGRFYASTGVSIDRMEVLGQELRVTAENAEAIAVVGQDGSRLAWKESPEITFDASMVSSFVFRIECYGRAGRMAWTQPFRLMSPRVEKIIALINSKPSVAVPSCKNKPVLTGDLSDPAWRKAAVTDRFIRSADGSAPAVRTEFRCVVHDNVLYFGISCEEPLADKMNLSIRQDGSGSLWRNDGIELFLDMEDKGARYLHVMVNAAGFACARRRGYLAGADPVPVLAKSAASDTGYTIEVAIPMERIGGRDYPRQIGFNLVRNRYAVVDCFTWSFVGDNNHEPSRFGQLSLNA